MGAPLDYPDSGMPANLQYTAECRTYESVSPEESKKLYADRPIIMHRNNHQSNVSAERNHELEML